MLQLINVTKSFAGQTVLNAVDWHLRPGERIGLCGENGAGKTTLLRLLAGQHEPDAGTVQMARGTLVVEAALQSWKERRWVDVPALAI